MIRLLKRAEYPPEYRARAGIETVAIGGCYLRNRRITSHHAHAHYGRGMICFATDAYFQDQRIRIHELAHLVSGQGHTNKFRQVFKDLGGVPQTPEELGTHRNAGHRHSWGFQIKPSMKHYEFLGHLDGCSNCGLLKLHDNQDLLYIKPETLARGKLLGWGRAIPCPYEREA